MQLARARANEAKLLSLAEEAAATRIQTRTRTRRVARRPRTASAATQMTPLPTPQPSPQKPTPQKQRLAAAASQPPPPMPPLQPMRPLPPLQPTPQKATAALPPQSTPQPTPQSALQPTPQPTSQPTLPLQPEPPPPLPPLEAVAAKGPDDEAAATVEAAAARGSEQRARERWRRALAAATLQAYQRGRLTRARTIEQAPAVPDRLTKQQMQLEIIRVNRECSEIDSKIRVAVSDIQMLTKDAAVKRAAAENTRSELKQLVHVSSNDDALEAAEVAEAEAGRLRTKVESLSGKLAALKHAEEDERQRKARAAELQAELVQQRNKMATLDAELAQRLQERRVPWGGSHGGAELARRLQGRSALSERALRGGPSERALRDAPSERALRGGEGLVSVRCAGGGI